jgi:uncharacterized protein (TIGR00369 family)
VARMGGGRESGRPVSSSQSEIRVRASFEKQAFMTLLGARLASVAPGEVDVELPFRDDLVQQHGYLHAGVTTAIADSACGYAALSLMVPDAAVLSVEFKVNLLAPAKGGRFLARGRVVKSGRTVTVVRGEVLAFDDRDEAHIVLVMQGTMITVVGRGITD